MYGTKIMTGAANSAASWYRASAAGSEESRKVNDMKVYLVVFEWSTEDDSDVDTQYSNEIYFGDIEKVNYEL